MPSTVIVNRPLYGAETMAVPTGVSPSDSTPSLSESQVSPGKRNQYAKLFLDRKNHLQGCFIAFKTGSIISRQRNTGSVVRTENEATICSEHLRINQGTVFSGGTVSYEHRATAVSPFLRRMMMFGVRRVCRCPCLHFKPASLYLCQKVRKYSLQVPHGEKEP